MSIARTAKKGVTLWDSEKTDPGYTLFSTYSNDVWLIAMDGSIVNRWKVPYTPGQHQVLLPSGNLLFAGKLKDHDELGLPVEMAAIGGVLLELDWNSNLVSKAVVPYQNHAICPLENGHILYHSYHPDGILPDEYVLKLKGGRRGTEFNGQVWGDMIHEIDGKGKEIWSWKAFEHLDPGIDFPDDYENRTLWPYINSLWKCTNGDILASLRCVNEIIRINYGTKEVVARYGRGRIKHQHDARELPNGNILVFDNGSHRHEYAASYSRVVEIDPENDEIVWEYKATRPSDFYSPVCGGSERLPNGNTVICDSWTGRIFEVTSSGELVWEFISPHVGSIVGMSTTMMWRGHRYSADYPGFSNQDLSPERFPMENMLYGPDALSGDFSPMVV